MLVILLGSGNGLMNGITSNVKDIATNTVLFWFQNTTEPYKGFKKGRSWNMSVRDLPILKSKFNKEIKYMAPIIEDWWRTDGNNVVYGDKGGEYRVNGHYPDYNEMMPVNLIDGRFINDIDITQNRKVCVIGEKIYKELFAGKPAIGKPLKVNGIYYQVVGVMKQKSDMNINGTPDEKVYLPYSTMKHAYNMGDDIYYMAITANDGYSMTKLQDELFATIKMLHHVSPTDKRAIGSFNMQEQFDMFNNLFLGVYVLIWIVGLGTLVSGVVGVSNIMLVTVKERTKEIGIRRALGARPRVIVTQILTESLVLTSMAGLIAICVGVGVLAMVDSAMGGAPSTGHTFFQDPQVDFSSAIVATIVILVSGTAAGIMPAMRAMQIKAIEALNEE